MKTIQPTQITREQVTWKTLPRFNKIAIITFGIGIIVFLAALALPDSKPDTKADSMPTEADGYIKALSYVRQNLKSPKSASFPYSGYKHNVSKTDSVYTYSCFVDAKNSFNAEIRSQWYVKMKYLGSEKWVLLDFKME